MGRRPHRRTTRSGTAMGAASRSRRSRLGAQGGISTPPANGTVTPRARLQCNAIRERGGPVQSCRRHVASPTWGSVGSGHRTGSWVGARMGEPMGPDPRSPPCVDWFRVRPTPPDGCPMPSAHKRGPRSRLGPAGGVAGGRWKAVALDAGDPVHASTSECGNGPLSVRGSRHWMHCGRRLWCRRARVFRSRARWHRCLHRDASAERCRRLLQAGSWA